MNTYTDYRDKYSAPCFRAFTGLFGSLLLLLQLLPHHSARFLQLVCPRYIRFSACNHAQRIQLLDGLREGATLHKKKQENKASAKHPVKERLQVFAPVLKDRVNCHASTASARLDLTWANTSGRSPNKRKTKSCACSGRVNENNRQKAGDRRRATNLVLLYQISEALLLP
jgi:hypothetical protein